MEEKQIIPYKEGDELQQGVKYISECGIEFVYDKLGNNEKPFLLNNGYRKDHVPNRKDIPTNNLTSFQNMTKEEIHNITSKGGKRSQEVQRNRRTFKESMEMILSIKASKDTIEQLPDEVKQYISSNGIEPTLEDLINIKATLMAVDGSIQHAIYSRDTVGEKPTDRQEITADIMTDGDRSLLEKLSKRLEDR